MYIHAYIKHTAGHETLVHLMFTLSQGVIHRLGRVAANDGPILMLGGQVTRCEY